MDPPGKIGSELIEQQQPPPPQPFEIALVRKIESKTTSVRAAFLFLDVDGDGRITSSDVRTVAHNELGLDLTKEQEDCLFARSQHLQNKDKENQHVGMGYAAFAKYFYETSKFPFPASQSGLAAAVGFHRDSSDDNTRANSEMAIHLAPKTILRQKRQQLRQLLTAHSSREGHGNSGMKETSLFLAMDVHRSGKVTMQEFLDWLNTVGFLEWSMEDLRQVVLGSGDNGGIDSIESEKLEMQWFGGATNSDDNEKREAGMTEQDFAKFVESLDSE